MEKKTLQIETVHQCNCCLGTKTTHPLACVIDLSKIDLTTYSIQFDFYAILLIENESNNFIYGRKYYDYSNATLLFLSPRQSIQIKENKSFLRKGWLLAFHPQLFCGTSLGMNIAGYTFFSYRLDEALHLSLREKTKALDCLGDIDQELQHAIDKHSKVLISRNIELLLDYCSRFYERQFITRDEANKLIINKMDQLFDKYIQVGKLKSKVLPSAEYCSEMLHLSPHYLCDLLKFETGKTVSEYFQLKRIEMARRMLLDKSSNVSWIVEELGFPDVSYFNKVFKKITGITPVDYRLAQN